MLTSVLLDERIIPQPASRYRVHRCQLSDDYHVARPHRILAETSTNAVVIASPRRLSAWNGGQGEDAIITTAPRRQAASGGVATHRS